MEIIPLRSIYTKVYRGLFRSLNDFPEIVHIGIQLYVEVLYSIGGLAEYIHFLLGIRLHGNTIAMFHIIGEQQLIKIAGSLDLMYQLIRFYYRKAEMYGHIIG
tara:strand:- start:22746 stop:23054 length:309 start_codon:yes stop_codon:yes gene_type:complete